MINTLGDETKKCYYTNYVYFLSSLRFFLISLLNTWSLSLLQGSKTVKMKQSLEGNISLWLNCSKIIDLFSLWQAVDVASLQGPIGSGHACLTTSQYTFVIHALLYKKSGLHKSRWQTNNNKQFNTLSTWPNVIFTFLVTSYGISTTNTSNQVLASRLKAVDLITVFPCVKHKTTDVLQCLLS